MLLLMFDGSLVTGVTVPLVERNVLLVASNTQRRMKKEDFLMGYLKKGDMKACVQWNLRYR